MKHEVDITYLFQEARIRCEVLEFSFLQQAHSFLANTLSFSFLTVFSSTTTGNISVQLSKTGFRFKIFFLFSGLLLCQKMIEFGLMISLFVLNSIVNFFS